MYFRASFAIELVESVSGLGHGVITFSHQILCFLFAKSFFVIVSRHFIHHSTKS